MPATHHEPQLETSLSDRLMRRVLIFSVGHFFTIPYFEFLNSVELAGKEILLSLPRKNVVLLSNHQTYFTEAIAFFYILYMRLNLPYEDPYLRFSAATETMKKNLVTEILTKSGGVTFKRSFREGGVDIKRPVDFEGLSRVEAAIKDGWLLHFPAGTTKKGAPLRPGVAQLLHRTKALTVPMRVSGFRELLVKGQIPGRVFRKASIQIMQPLDLETFYQEPFNKETGRGLVESLTDLLVEKE